MIVVELTRTSGPTYGPLVFVFNMIVSWPGCNSAELLAGQSADPSRFHRKYIFRYHLSRCTETILDQLRNTGFCLRCFCLEWSVSLGVERRATHRQTGPTRPIYQIRRSRRTSPDPLMVMLNRQVMPMQCRVLWPMEWRTRRRCCAQGTPIKPLTWSTLASGHNLFRGRLQTTRSIRRRLPMLHEKRESFADMPFWIGSKK